MTFVCRQTTREKGDVVKQPEITEQPDQNCASRTRFRKGNKIAEEIKWSFRYFVNFVHRYLKKKTKPKIKNILKKEVGLRKTAERNTSEVREVKIPI